MKGPSAVLSVQISAEKSGSLKAQEMIYTDCTKTMKLLSMYVIRNFVSEDKYENMNGSTQKEKPHYC